jgi:hypothetical protein
MVPLLLVVALVCFLLSAFGVAARVNLQSLGLAFWVGASIGPLSSGAFNVNQLLIILVVVLVLVLVVFLTRVPKPT